MRLSYFVKVCMRVCHVGDRLVGRPAEAYLPRESSIEVRAGARAHVCLGALLRPGCSALGRRAAPAWAVDRV